jgi:DNA-binding MarR family transcriptional regulator
MCTTPVFVGLDGAGIYVVMTPSSSDVTSLAALPCGCAALRRAARAVTQLYDDALRPSGLRVTQFTILQVLERGGEMTQGQLGKKLALDSTTLSRTLRLLEGEGWIASRPGEDRRERHIGLSRSGEQQLRAAQPHWEKVQERLKASLGQPGWAQLMTTLDRTTAAAQQT